jgi:hypothetical protein
MASPNQRGKVSHPKEGPMTTEVMAAEIAASEPAIETNAPPAKPRAAQGTREETAGHAAALLGTDGAWRAALLRAGSGLGLAALFGLALGTRHGGSWLVTHALLVPAAPLVILALGVPALCIALASFDSPLSTLQVARCAARGTAACGLLLGGLAPLAALYLVSADTQIFGALVAAGARVFAGVVAIACFHAGVAAELKTATPNQRSIALLSVTVFDVLATIAAARVWLGELPLFGGTP